MATRFQGFFDFFPSFAGISVYMWEGTGFSGKKDWGVCHCANRKQAEANVASLGFLEFKVRKIPESLVKKNLSEKKLIRFVHSLKVLLGCGLRLEETLKAILQENHDLELKFICSSILSGLNAGESFNVAFGSVKNKLPFLVFRLIELCAQSEDLRSMADIWMTTSTTSKSEETGSWIASAIL